MSTFHKDGLSPKSQEQLAALQRAVAQALDRKKRLGQYAVIWKDNKPVAIGEDAPRWEQTEFQQTKKCAPRNRIDD